MYEIPGIKENFLPILLLRIFCTAALASLVVAWKPLREVVTGERRAPMWRFARVLLETAVIASTAPARILLLSPGTDLSLEGSFLMGWIHGPTTGLICGLIFGLAEVWGGHWGAAPVLAITGFLAGELALRYPDAVGWTSGATSGNRKSLRETAITVSALLALEGIWLLLGIVNVVPDTVSVGSAATFVGATLGAALTIAAPIWIWRSFRMEAELEKRARQIEKIRMENLMERFRPHFLFNTLGAIVSLMRSDVEGARKMTIKLAGLLRRSMSDRDDFSPLRDELRFLSDYLDIESIRHGDRLKIVEDVGDDVLDARVPKMILQPLVENAILHGIDPKLEGGTVTIHGWKDGACVRLEVSDDGVGIEDPPREGIGLANLRARLETAYENNAARLEITARPNSGTTASLRIPLEAKK